MRPLAPLLLGGFCAIQALAAVLPEQFPVCKTLTPPAEPRREVGAVILDRELFAALDARYANLRLFDEAGQEVPFLVRRRASSKAVEAHAAFAAPARIEAFRELPENQVEFILARGTEAAVPAGLRFRTSLRNFEKLVTVSGGNDRQNWVPVAADQPLYDYSRFADVRQDTVRFPPADYAFFRVCVSNIVEKKDSPLVEIVRQTRGAAVANELEATSFQREPFRIDDLTFLQRREILEPGTVETRETAATNWHVRQNPKQQTTVVELVTRRQPLMTLTLRIAESNFFRTLSVEGKPTAGEAAWETVVSRAGISRMHAGRIHEDALTVPFPAERRYREYRITIHNQDNPPLTVTGLGMREQVYELVFFPQPGASYKLYYGGVAGESPRYDTEAIVGRLPGTSADLWGLSVEAHNVRYAQRGRWIWPKARVFLVGAIVLMVAVLILLIATLSRKVDKIQ
jgi:hypothetical protein